MGVPEVERKQENCLMLTGRWGRKGERLLEPCCKRRPMADASGYATPRHFQRSTRPSLSGSPRPTSSSSPLARAQWPWSSSLQYVQRPSSAMSSQASNTATHWEASSSASSMTQSQSWAATPRNAAVQPSLHIATEYEDHGIRQWNFSVRIIAI
jgi:hypothetical protein